MSRPRRRAEIVGNPAVAVGYVRVSDEHGRQEYGPLAQRDAVDRWAAAQGVRIAAVEEDKTSGGLKDGEEIEDALDRRTGLFAAFDALAAHGAGVLVVARRDRLARDPGIMSTIEREVRRRGARIVSVAGEGTERDDPTSILLRRITDAVAEHERAIIRGRVRAALGAKQARGERTGSVPYGFRLAADGVHLLPHPDERKAVARAQELRAEGRPLAFIADALDTAGHVPRGGGRWHVQTISNILARWATVPAAEGSAK